MNKLKQNIKYRRWEIEQKRKYKLYNCRYKTYKNMNGVLSTKLIMPPILDIYGNHSHETMTIIQWLEKYQQYSLYQTIILDFRETRYIKAAALVILFAALDRLITDFNKEIKIIHSRNIKINRTLEQSGILNLCRNRMVSNNFDKEYLPIISSTGGKHREDIVDFLAKKIYKDMPAVLENIYADAIQEAINNVAAHAYLNFNEHIKKKWWLLCELIGNQLYLALYDTGIGIPASFEINMNWIDRLDITKEQVIQDLKNIYQKELKWAENAGKTFEDYIETIKQQKQNKQKNIQLPDSHKIYLAMYADITRKEGRDELKHGQGSKSIKALVSNNDDGVLWIFSGFGRMQFRSDTETPNLTTLSSKLTGTLIQWNIQVAS